jgi:hypothetical protein
LEVIAKLQEILVQGGGKLALAMPRGSGKTSLVETAIIWAVLFGHCRFIVAIGANHAEAKKIINNIKAALATNKELLADFPESVYPFHKLKGSALLARGQLYLGELTGIEWKPDMVVFPKIPGNLSRGAVIVSVGIHGAVRGKNRTMPDGSIARPDAIILDDVATKNDALSPRGTEKIIGKIEEDVSGLVGPADEMAMFMACTVIRDGDVASYYLDRVNRPQWNGLRYKMVETMPERMDLWEKYADVRRSDPVAATMFYRQNRTEMKKGAVVAWEANYTGNELDALQYAMNKWAATRSGIGCFRNTLTARRPSWSKATAKPCTNGKTRRTITTFLTVWSAAWWPPRSSESNRRKNKPQRRSDGEGDTGKT